MHKRPEGPVVLVILDGWGIRREKEGNAVMLARTPTIDRCLAAYPKTILQTSGEAVGLMAGQMGDSNVGHLNIGAGRIVLQDLQRINRAVQHGEFSTNPEIQRAMDSAKRKNTSLHLMGLLSDGGVHSHIHHLMALLDECQKKGLTDVCIHAFLDGRDVLPKSASTYIEMLEEKIRHTGSGTICTVMGRYYSMDRDNRWDRVQLAYDAMVLGKGLKSPNAMEALEAAYERGETDEFVLPTVIVDDCGKPKGRVREDDSVIFFNFRADRAREITRAFVQDDLPVIQRPDCPPKVHYVCMTEYAEDIAAPVAFPPDYLKNTLGEVLSEHGMKQLRVAETEKYAHVTFFFNGGREDPFPGEDRSLIPSPSVPTYEMKPEMSAYEVAQVVTDAIHNRSHDVVIVNFANLDMVGHTGKLWAAVKAAEAVDQCLGKILAAQTTKNGVTLIISDHGNAEYMMDMSTGKAFTAHTSSDVYGVLVGYKGEIQLRDKGVLGDVAPTILDLLQIPQPVEMTGKTLLCR